MKARGRLALMLLSLICLPGTARAEWTDLSKGLPETDIQAVAVDRTVPGRLYAASPRRVYLSQDLGAHWKQALSLRGSDNRIHFILVDPSDGRRVFVASERGIQASSDAGKSWEYLYRGVGKRAKAVYSLAADPRDPGALWAGTSDGLAHLERKQAQIVPGIPSVKVFSIFTAKEAPEKLWAATEKGVYKSEDAGAHWERIYIEMVKGAEAADETSLSQFQIEELLPSPSMSNVIRFPGTDDVLAASSKGVWRGSSRDWMPLKNTQLPVERINYLTASAEAFYAATDRGVFRWREGEGFKDVSDGLSSKEVRMIAYDERSGDLFAATRQGAFRYPKPDFKPSVTEGSAAQAASAPDAREILKRFENEPTIGQVQNAAIRYAEVHPDKIQAWRAAAARKALFPTFSVTADSGTDHNVDIDRGGTGDPDKFIIGPEETNTDWHAGFSWDLGELIWNNDQTSIDTRSKLLVELRDDVLNEVTHLYYERRRLQVEMLLTPAKELPLEIERQLKLDELTAGIDGLTGGYFSKALGAARV